jgi:hypothetical protein
MSAVQASVSLDVSPQAVIDFRAGTLALATVDGGESLWKLYQSFSEVEHWWDPEHAA